jgi:HSP20 family protein
VYLSNRFPSLFDDTLFRNFFEAGMQARKSAGVFPSLNVYDDGQRFLVRAELPGVSKESLEITAEGEELTLSGERTWAVPDGASEHRREAWSGKFRRTVTLPQLFDAEKIEAKYENGVLEIALPRHQSVTPRKISVQ